MNKGKKMEIKYLVVHVCCFKLYIQRYLILSVVVLLACNFNKAAWIEANSAQALDLPKSVQK